MSLRIVVFEFWCCWNDDEEDLDGLVIDVRNENCCGLRRLKMKMMMIVVSRR
jgi:hypothetical protein